MSDTSPTLYQLFILYTDSTDRYTDKVKGAGSLSAEADAGVEWKNAWACG